MAMSAPLRKLALLVHVIASVGWLGALMVFLAHALVSWTAEDVQTVRAAALAMATGAWFVILPLAVVSLASGLIQALGTPWGLIRHYWLVFKLVLTAAATFVLLLKLAPISEFASVASGLTFSGNELPGLRASLVAHAVGGLIVLLAAATLAVFKPVGLTGWAKGGESTHVVGASNDQAARHMPKWAKVFAAIVAGLLLLVAMMVVAGNHGPAAHMTGRSGSTGVGLTLPLWQG